MTYEYGDSGWEDQCRLQPSKEFHWKINSMKKTDQIKLKKQTF